MVVTAYAGLPFAELDRVFAEFAAEFGAPSPGVMNK
jgi:hypothetical protein